jgi:CRP-like cAMP-binding protein
VTVSTLTQILQSLSGGSGVPRRLDAGEMLFTTGDPVRSLFVVDKGQLRLLRHTASGATLTLHVARTGEAFAEASLFSPTYHCDAAADVRSTVMAYSKLTLLAALREDPGAALALTAHLARQVHMLRGQIELLNIRPARERVLAYLHNHKTCRSRADVEGDCLRNRPHARGRLSSSRRARAGRAHRARQRYRRAATAVIAA